MPIPLDLDVRRLLDAPNFAAFTTLMPDGTPKVEPVWVGLSQTGLSLAEPG